MLDLLERHTAPAVEPDGGVRDIAVGAPIWGPMLTARVLLRTLAGSLLIWSVPVPTPTVGVAVLQRLVSQAAIDPRVSPIDGRYVEALRA
mgnify:CR=1 FL=1